MWAASILVIDDDAAVRAVVRRLLERLGAVVTVAADLEPEPALDVDLVLCDVHLPGGSGLDFGRFLAVPVVYMTGDQDIVRSLHVLGTPVLPKPFTVEELAAAVAAAAPKLPL